MKKIFRMALVCALAGATLLYTGCTKDYSEDINNLESRLDNLEGVQIKGLESRIQSLEQAKTALEAFKTSAETAISTLQTKVSSLETAVADLNTYKQRVADAETKIGQIEGSISTINKAIETINGQIGTINGQISKLQGDITRIDGQIGTINDTLGKLQTEVGKKADKAYVDETFATIKMVNDSLGAIRGDMAVMAGEINDIKGDIDNINDDLDLIFPRLSNAEAAIGTIQGNIEDMDAAISAAFDEYNKTISAIQGKLDTLQSDMAQAKKDIITAQNTADKAQEDATKALTETGIINEALKNIYKKNEVDAIVAALDSTLTKRIAALEDRVGANETEIANLKNLKLDVAAYKADTAVLNTKVRGIEALLAQTIEDYKNADDAINARIDTLAQNVYALLDTKLDKATFEEFVEELESTLNAMQIDINKLLDRVQSLNNVPQYSDDKLRVPFGILTNGEVIGNQDGANAPSNEPAVANNYIESSMVVKYRVYGRTAEDIAEAIVEAQDSLVENGILFFDVVSVIPVKVNEEGASLEIVSIAVSELDPCVLDITVAPRGLGDEFYAGQSRNQKSYSVSLVMNDVEKNNQIQSHYNNLVPADQCTEIRLQIMKGDKDVTWTVADSIEVEYTDLEPKAVLETEVLRFAMGEDLLSYEEMVAANWAVPAPVFSVADEADLTKAIDAAAVKAAIAPDTTYFNLASTDSSATIALEKVVKEGVYAEDLATVTYTVGNVYVQASQYEQVVPVKVAVSAEIWETAAKQPFVWAYELDAESDSIAYANGDVPTSYRDSAVVKINPESLKALDSLDITLKDFDHKVAKSWTVTCDSTTADVDVYPYFVDGQLLLDVYGFEWDKEYTVTAVYELPDTLKPAVQVTVTATFTTVDRSRENIVVVLPESTFDFDVAAIDTTFNVKNEATSIVVSLPEAHLTDANLVDALMKHSMDTNKTIELVYPEKPDTLSANITDNGPTCNHKTVQIFANGCEEDVMDVTTLLNLHSLFFRGLDTLATQYDYTDTITLWYGQKVVVEKTIKINTTDIFEFERINEYVVWDPANTLHTTYTTLQPWWTPDDATLDFSMPIDGYDAHEVLLDQHFRVRNQKNGESCTDLEGAMKPEYSYLRRTFTLENGAEEVTAIADPRNVETMTVSQATGVTIENNVVAYYSMADYADVYGHLDAVIPENGAIMPLKTRFDAANANWPVVKNDASEDYVTYAIKLYDPLQEIIAPEDVQRVNINNSVQRQTSIYDFLSLSDKRGWELIDGQSANGWVEGNDENGFVSGKTADQVYSLTFTNTMEYLTEVSDETKDRITFDSKTGKINFRNTHQTQLAQDIRVKLGIVVDYPWGQRTAYVTVEFYNTPVGE